MSKHPHALVHPFRLTLAAFIQDLNSLEATGLQQEQCDAVLACLDSIIEHLKHVPETSTWLPELMPPFSNLRTEYFHWNNPKSGAHPPSHRATQCKLIRRQKDGILPRYRFGALFATVTERQTFVKIYDEFIRLEKLKSFNMDSRIPLTTFRKTVERAREKQSAIPEVA